MGVEGEELVRPSTPSEPVTRANSLFCGDDKPGLSNRTSLATECSSHCPSVQAVKTWESEPVSEVGQPLRLPKRGRESDSLSEEDFSAVAVSVHENEASISAAVYDVSRDGDDGSDIPVPDADFEVEISEHMNDASISAACYEGRNEL